MAITPGTYLRLRREAAGLSIEDVAIIIGTDPHMNALGRAHWLRLVESDQTPISANVIDTLRTVFLFDQLVLMDLADIARGASGVPEPRLCHRCACSEACACVDKATGLACYWVAPELCSACRTPERRETSIELPKGLAA